MILRFLAEASQSPRLRRELAQNPGAVMDRYEIPESQQEILLEADRRKLGRLLHEEIDRMMTDYNEVIWPGDCPMVIGHGQTGPSNDIRIMARNVKAPVGVRFQKGPLDSVVDATVLDVEALRGGFFSVVCRGTFPEPGDYDVIVANEANFDEKFSTKACYIHAN